MTPQQYTSDYAVVVGIDWYPALGNLGGPRRDATAFAKWLTDPTGGGLDPARVKPILSPNPVDGEPRPVANEIHKAFDEIYTLAKHSNNEGRGMKVGRRLYLYFSGHGFSPDNDETALLMANATREWVGYHIPGRGYANWFFTAGFFEEVVLFMDCCREEYATAPMTPPHFQPLKNKKAKVKRFYGYATRWSRLARERVMSDDGLPRGVFTTALLAGLCGAGANPEGKVTSASLGSFLFEKMRTFLDPADLAAASDPQEPDFFLDPPFGEGIIFATVAPPQATVAIRVAAPSSAQLIGPAMSSVATTTAGPPAWSYSVIPGVYLARKVATGGVILAEKPITLTQGEHLDVTL